MFFLLTRLKLSSLFSSLTLQTTNFYFQLCVGKPIQSSASERDFHSPSLGFQCYLKVMTVSHSDCGSIAFENKRDSHAKLLNMCITAKCDDEGSFMQVSDPAKAITALRNVHSQVFSDQTKFIFFSEIHFLTRFGDWSWNLSQISRFSQTFQTCVGVQTFQKSVRRILVQVAS